MNLPQSLKAPALALCGMIILEADEVGLGCVKPIQSALADLPEAAIVGPERQLFSAIRIALAQGVPPSVTNLLNADPTIKGALLSQAKHLGEEAGGFGAIKAAAHQIRTAYNAGVLTERLTAALTAVQKGDLTGGVGIISQLDLPRLSGALSGAVPFNAMNPEAVDLARPFELTHQSLNHALGGGLGTGLSLGMSLWVAPTGVGKSTFWWKEIPHLCQQGHWVLYFAAESDAESIFQQVTRIRAELSMDAMRRRNAVPVFKDRFVKAANDMKTFQGETFRVWSDPFDSATVMREVERLLGEMEEVGAAGKLMVIIDNYDALSEMARDNRGGGSAAMAIIEELQWLQRHTREHDYHIAMLAQATSEDEVRHGPGTGEVYGNRKAASKFSQVIALYRPRSNEALNMTNPDNTPHVGACAWMALRKNRLGLIPNIEIQMSTSDNVGAWTELGHLPF